MTLFAICDVCKKKKIYVAHRQYVFDKISKAPMISKGKFCNSCHKGYLKILKKMK